MIAALKEISKTGVVRRPGGGGGVGHYNTIRHS